MEGDRETLRSASSCPSFQSTPSAWRETDHLPRTVRHLAISIHSLRMEGDLILSTLSTIHNYFNPLPPHGGRQSTDKQEISTLSNFNPLPPHGGRQWKAWFCTANRNFNPLPPHGGRQNNGRSPNIQTYFNPLPPHGGRPNTFSSRPAVRLYFNPLPPHGGRPVSDLGGVKAHAISIHSLRMEGDFVKHFFCFCGLNISIHSLRMEGDLHRFG